MSSSEYPSIKKVITMKKDKVSKPSPSKIGIQRGDVTHHQDQSILFVSFNTRNTMNITLVKLKPVFELLLDI